MFKRIFKGCGIFVGVVVLGVFIIAVFLSYRIATPEIVIQRFHSSLNDGDFDKAYSCLSANTRSKLSQYEFITKVNSFLPFEIRNDNREAIFKKFWRLTEIEIIKTNFLRDHASVELRIAFPAEKAIDVVLKQDQRLKLMKEEIDQLGNELNVDRVLVYNKAGELMLAVLDSLYNQRRMGLFQFYDVRKVTVSLEFEFSEWKINDAI